MLARRRSSAVRSGPERAPPQAMRQSDLELVQAARSGRPESVEDLLGRMRVVPRILMAINVRLGWPLDDHEVEDACQETISKLWRKLETFTGESTLETWFYGVARYELMNALRRKQRRAPGSELSDEEPDRVEASPHADELERVRAALAQIEADDARIIVLHHYHSQSLEQAARIVGVPTSTAKSRYYRGMERLAALLRRRTLEAQP